LILDIYSIFILDLIDSKVEKATVGKEPKYSLKAN